MNSVENRKKYIKAAITGAAIVSAGGLLSLVLTILTGGDFSEYHAKTCIFSPPAWLFPVVWSVLYPGIGGSAGIVSCIAEKDDPNRKKGLLLFGVMMLLNVIWSPLFFSASAYGSAFINIVFMLILTAGTLCYFRIINRACAVVLGVYWIWLLYSLILNACYLF